MVSRWVLLVVLMLVALQTPAGAQQPVTVANSPTVTANIGTSGSLALDATLTGRWPAAYADADAIANQTTSSVHGHLFGYNGTTWDRLRADTTNGLWVNCKSGCAGGSTTPTDAFANPTTAGLSAAFNMGWNGATWDRLQVDASKFLKVNCATGCSGGATTPSDAFANPTTAGLSASFNMGWNGATWDRLKSTTANGLVVDVSRVQGNVTATQGTAAASTAGWPATSGTVARTSAAWTSATSVDTTLAQAVTGYAVSNITVNTTSTFTGGTLNFEVSDDGGTTWFSISSCQIAAYTCGNTYALVASTKIAFDIDVDGFTNVRVRLNPAITGTGTATIGMLSQATASEPSVVVGQSVAANLQMTVGAALPAGTNVIGKVAIDQTTPGTTNLVALAANQSVNVAQINGVTTTTGNGVAGTGVQRVAIASDNTAFTVNAAQSGTWTVQPGNTANTTPWIVQTVPGATNGASTCNLQSAATTNATNCKASAGTLYGYEVINTTGTLYYLRLYNLTTSPTCSSSTGFIRSIPIPAATTGAGVERDMSVGEAYGTGLGFCLTGGGSSTDNTNAATGVYISLLYK